MATKNKLVPEAKEALNKFKMEAASEVGVNLKNGYNGDLTSRQAGSVGGQMVKKMIEKYENDLRYVSDFSTEEGRFPECNAFRKDAPLFFAV